MTTATTARQTVRARMEGGAIVDANDNPVPLRWQNEDADSAGNTMLPDTPAPFVYTEFLTGPAQLIGFGGGRNANLYRSPVELNCYAFVPKGDGLDQAELIAEQIAALFRSYRDTNISCFDATVAQGGDGSDLKPPGLESEVVNYFYAVCEIRLHYDQIG
jgi:hypothetical protein